MRRPLRRLAVCAALAVLCLGLTEQASAAPQELPPLRLRHHTITDREGYGKEIDAVSLLLPVDWKVEKSRIAWNKPCSGNDLYEIIFRVRSPDGRFGIQLLPSHRIEYFASQIHPGAMPPDLVAMAEAEQNRLHQQVIEAYRGSNCHFTEPHGALEVVRRHILPDRPSGTRIVGTTELTELRDNLARMQRQTLTPVPQTETTIGADAVTVRLAYESNGVSYEEDVSVAISGSTFRSVWPTLGRTDTNSAGFTLPIESVWAPAGRLEEIAPLVSAVKRSMRGNPRWLKAVAKTRAAIDRIRREGLAARAEIWAQASQEISDMQMQSWQTSQQTSDELHDKFTDTILEVQDMVDPATGQELEMPAFYDNYYSNGDGDYVALPAGADVNELYPYQSWQEMAPAD